MESALSDGAFEPGLRLIETMRWDGQGFALLALHMARLRRSAAALGWPAPAAVMTALTGLPAGALRVRLAMDCFGALVVEVAALPAAKAMWRVAVAGVRVDSGDAWLRVKSTRRPVYDAARAGLPAGVDEMIFLNERDEVCEGTITSVFFDRGAGMRTPPLRCGVLPGVLRAKMAVAEEVLLAEDLGKVRLWVGNAVRGLVPAIFLRKIE